MMQPIDDNACLSPMLCAVSSKRIYESVHAYPVSSRPWWRLEHGEIEVVHSSRYDVDRLDKDNSF